MPDQTLPEIIEVHEKTKQSDIENNKMLYLRFTNYYKTFQKDN